MRTVPTLSDMQISTLRAVIEDIAGTPVSASPDIEATSRRRWVTALRSLLPAQAPTLERTIMTATVLKPMLEQGRISINEYLTAVFGREVLTAAPARETAREVPVSPAPEVLSAWPWAADSAADADGFAAKVFANSQAAAEAKFGPMVTDSPSADAGDAGQDIAEPDADSAEDDEVAPVQEFRDEDWIVSAEDVLGGAPTVRGTRVGVDLVVRLLDGSDDGEIQAWYPTLPLAGIAAVRRLRDAGSSLIPVGYTRPENGRRRWRPEDDRVVRSGMSDEEASRHLGRTVEAVRCRRRTLHKRDLDTVGAEQFTDPTTGADRVPGTADSTAADGVRRVAASPVEGLS